MFLPISFKQMSYFRKAKFEQAKAKGYSCVSYVSSKATTWSDLNIGENCFIFEDNMIAAPKYTVISNFYKRLNRIVFKNKAVFTDI